MLLDDTRPKSDEIGILDLLVVIAESWIVIVLVPLLAMGVAFVLTRDAGSYTASAPLAVAASRVVPVVREAFPGLVVEPIEENSSRIRAVADTPGKARADLASAIEVLADTPFLTEELTVAEVSAVEVWTSEAARLRRSLERVEASYETSVTTDPGSYASAVTVLMTELGVREHNLRKSAIRLAQKLVGAPEHVRITITSNTASSGGTIPLVGLAVGLLTILAVLLGNALRRLDADAKDKFSRIRRAFFISKRNAG
jgi:hypothetical protein